MSGVSMCTFWHGKLLRTVGDHLDAMAAVTTEAEAEAFTSAVRQTHGDMPHWEFHFGYLFGEFDYAERLLLMDLFHMEHPIFGRHDPDQMHLVLAGMLLADGVPVAVVRRQFGWD